MNERRLELHEIFCEILNMPEPDGDSHVYFQPPSSVKLKYPAIVYKLKDVDVLHADDGNYLQNPAFEGVLIDPKPDCVLFEKIIALPYCRFDRYYASDNLNHYTFTIY